MHRKLFYMRYVRLGKMAKPDPMVCYTSASNVPDRPLALTM